MQLFSSFLLYTIVHARAIMRSQSRTPLSQVPEPKKVLSAAYLGVRHIHIEKAEFLSTTKHIHRITNAVLLSTEEEHCLI